MSLWWKNSLLITSSGSQIMSFIDQQSEKWFIDYCTYFTMAQSTMSLSFPSVSGIHCQLGPIASTWQCQDCMHDRNPSELDPWTQLHVSTLDAYSLVLFVRTTRKSTTEQRFFNVINRQKLVGTFLLHGIRFISYSVWTFLTCMNFEWKNSLLCNSFDRW